MPSVPSSTYRLQLHAGFDFAAATGVLGYLARLGVSHVYCSPVWAARPGSRHGYDVTDHARINDELGGEAGFRRFAAAAREHGMGLLLDVVPNHMGIFGADNPWWLDVLENGQSSEFARYFDIDWHPPNPALDAKLLVPVLGDHFGEVLDAGGLALHHDVDRGGFSLRYADHRFPLDPRTYPRLLDRLPPTLLPAWVIDGLRALPARDDADAEAVARRHDQQRRLRADLKRLAAEDAALGAAIARAVAEVNADPAALGELHDAQAYRLSYWRVASGEINYRRFFDVNDLAGLRIEEQAVFDATQSLPLSLVAEGVADGLRIDHSDGLFDPAQYFERLQAAHARLAGTAGRPAAQGAAPLYVVAEKIVGVGEQLPRWPIAGTSGYEFAALVNGLFVERSHADRMERVWRNFTGSRTAYADIVRRCKLRIARKVLGAESTVLANALQRLANRHRRTRDYSLPDLREALATVAACMPVYRTYVSDSGATPQDIRFIDSALAQARRHGDVDDPTLFDFLRDCLVPGETDRPDADRAERIRFAMRFQQFSSPVAAKGVEDTAFYRYHRLISLNEVGGSPAVFGTSAAEFHAANVLRQERWPGTMLATSTHDNKRAEDVRYRIDMLSEQPAALRLGLRRWRRAIDPWLGTVDGESAPSPEDLMLLYQTLLGTLPAHGFGPGELAPYRERIQQYMRKAQREAKRETSWNRPDDAYEAATERLVQCLLDDSRANPALDLLCERAAELAWFGALNGLSATVLKLTSPGVPDIYQGTEMIDLSLVDPDNRRPVDYAVREATLASWTPDTDPLALAGDPTDGRLKLWCVSRLLPLRRAMPAVFAGSYLPLRVRGQARKSLIAFARRSGDTALIVIVGRKWTGLSLRPGAWPGSDAWGDAWVQRPRWMPVGSVARNVLNGKSVAVDASGVNACDALGGLTVAVLSFDLPA